MSVFNPEDYWQISIKLASQKPSGADYRTAANRAYYACHLIGCDKGLIDRTYDAQEHSKLWRELRDRNLVWWTKLRSLYEIREHADYHVHSDIPQNANYPYCVGTTESMWGFAKAITEDILPRIKSLKRRDSKQAK